MQAPQIPAERIEHLIEHGYEPHLMKALLRGLRLTWEKKWAFTGIFVVYVLIGLFLAFIPVLGPLVNQFVVAPLFSAGLIWAYYLIWAGKWRDFGNFFDVLRFDLWKRMAGVYALNALIFLLVYSPSLFALERAGIIDWYFSYLEDPFGTEPLDPSVFMSKPFIVVWLNLIPLIYLAVAYSFAYYFALFVPEYGIWQCLEKSRQLVSRRWFSFFEYYLAYFGIMVGAMVLMVGVAYFMAIGSGVGVVVGLVLFFAIILLLLWVALSIYGGLWVAFAELTGLGQTSEQGAADEAVSPEDLV